MADGPWHAEWTFFSTSDKSLRDLSREETTERPEPWKLLVAALYSEAMLSADEVGEWRYASLDGWANVTVRFTP